MVLCLVDGFGSSQGLGGRKENPGFETPGDVISKHDDFAGFGLRKHFFFVWHPPVGLRLRLEHPKGDQVMKSAFRDGGFAPVAPGLPFDLLRGGRAGRPDADCPLHFLGNTLSSSLDGHGDG